MRKYQILILLLLTVSVTLAQETDTTKVWKLGGVTTLNFSQVAIENWAAGGENSYSTNGLISLFGNYKKGKTTWENTLDLGYGILKKGEQKVQKTDDKIDFASKFGYKSVNKWYYSAMLGFKTQFYEGTNPKENPDVKISDFLAPAYILSAIGMEYKHSDKFYVLISPFTGKTTIVLDDSLSAKGSFGVEAGKNFRNELGGYVKIAFKKDIMKNVNMGAKIDLFSNYLKKPEKIDVNCEALLAMKVNKYISATLSAQALYDYDVKFEDENKQPTEKWQFKEVFGVGFSYKF